MAKSQDELLTVKYDWPGLREWAIWCLALFLRWAPRLSAEGSYDQYCRELASRPISWRQVRQLDDDKINFVMNSVAAVVGEAAPLKAALPGTFREFVENAQCMKSALEKHQEIEDVVSAIGKIE